jgi:hypothetical protein
MDGGGTKFGTRVEKVEMRGIVTDPAGKIVHIVFPSPSGRGDSYKRVLPTSIGTEDQALAGKDCKNFWRASVHRISKFPFSAQYPGLSRLGARYILCSFVLCWSTAF